MIWLFCSLPDPTFRTQVLKFLGVQGCLAPVTIRIPSPSILSPTPEAAVVGGNVLTSQRVTDVVLKAFNAAAASQVLYPIRFKHILNLMVAAAVQSLTS